MEGAPGSFDNGESKKDEKSSGSKSEKSYPKLGPEVRSLEAIFSGEKKQDAAEKLGETSIFQRLGAESKATKADSGEKPAAEADATAKTTPEAAATESVVDGDAKQQPEQSTDFVEQSGEIRLGDVRDEAEQIIDLHAEAAQQEHEEAIPQSEAAHEAGAVGEFLEHAREEVQDAPDGQSVAETIDAAYDRTVAETQPDEPLPHTTEPSAPEDYAATGPAGAPPEAAPETPADTETPPPHTSASAPEAAIPVFDFAAEEAQHRQAEAEMVAPAASQTRSEGEQRTAQPDPTTPPYYRQGNGRWFYPGGPSRNPLEPSPLEKLTKPVFNRREKKAIRKLANQEADKKLQAVEQYIDRKEQAVRTVAREQYASAQTARAEVQTPLTAASAAAAAETRRPVRAAETSTAVARSAEQSLVAKPEDRASTVAAAQRTEQLHPAQRVQRMDHQELLKTSEKLTVDGVSVRSIYEAHRITEPGLRRVVYEYLRGGDIKHAVQAELEIKEMTYERDPFLRDLVAAEAAPITVAAAAIAATDRKRESQLTIPQKALDSRAAKDDKSNASGSDKKDMPPVVTQAWIVFVVLLVIIAVILLFSR